MEEVREFMHAPVISVDPQTTAQDAATLMGEKEIGSLLICHIKLIIVKLLFQRK